MAEKNVQYYQNIFVICPLLGLIFAIITGVGCRYPEGESPDALRWRVTVLQVADGKTGA